METFVQYLVRQLRRKIVFTISPALGIPEISVSILGTEARANIDERVAKIEAARSNLLEAIEAIDELREKAEENRQDLAALTEKLGESEKQKAVLDMELSTLKGLASLDTQSVRKSLGIPTRLQVWTERMISFGFGILASVIASAIWTRLPFGG